MFGWEFPPYQAGGLATATLGLVKGLIGAGEQVTLVVPFSAEASSVPGLRLVSADGAAPGLVVHHIASPLDPYGTAEGYQELLAPARKAGTRDLYGADLWQEIDRYAALAGDIAAREPHDVIDSHDWITFPAGTSARRISGKPLVAHIHATEYDRCGPGANPEIVRREYEGLHAADRIVANSHVIKRQVVERFGVAADKIDVVHWGIEESARSFGPLLPSPLPAEDPIVLFLGRVTWQKGPEYFMEVAGRVSGFVPNARFVVAGTGDLLPRLIERAAELGLADRVHFAGGLDAAEVDRAFRMSAVCVMPSVSEPFGLVGLESLRCGTPCILPRDSGVAEVIQNAFKIDYWDLDAMTECVVSLLRNPPLREELSLLGQAEIEQSRFRLEASARKTADSYRQVHRISRGI